MRAPRTRRTASFLALVSLATGCAEIDYRPATVENEVIEITEKEAYRGPRIKMKQQGRLLHVNTSRVCDMIEDKEVERTTIRETDENVWVESLLMGLATAPLTTGAVLLADADNVHPSDVNGRLYNSTGQSGAIALGVFSLVVGSGLLGGSMASIIRRKMPDTDSTTVHEDGAVVAPAQPCTSPSTAFNIQGVLDNGAQVNLGTTSNAGELTVDLARVVPASHFATINPPLSMQLKIGTEMFGIVDLEAVEAIHAERREKAWARAESGNCEAARTALACTGVQQFLSAFPNGKHATFARSLIANIGKPVAKPGRKPRKTRTKRVATSCADQCLIKCERDARCAAGCVKEQCR